MSRAALSTAGRFPVRRQRPNRPPVDNAPRLLASTEWVPTGPSYFTLYSLGLRLGEGLALKVGDIDAARLRVQVRDAKGNRDRLVPLPQATLSVLRRFWQTHRHPELLFPNRLRDPARRFFALAAVRRCRSSGGGFRLARSGNEVRQRWRRRPCKSRPRKRRGAGRRLGGARPENAEKWRVNRRICRIGPLPARKPAPPDQRIGQPAHLRAGIQKAICREPGIGLVQHPVQIVARSAITI